MNNVIGPPLGHLIETEIGDEISLYDPTTERVVVLNATASDVWRLADGEHTSQEILELLAKAYGVDPFTIREEVHGTLIRLRDEALLQGGEQ